MWMHNEWLNSDTQMDPPKNRLTLADSVHLRLMKFLNRGQCRHKTVVISEVGYRVKSSVNDNKAKLLRKNSRAARQVDSRRRMKTRRLLAQMAWIMEIIMREDLSDLPEELCACCSWTILTPQKCWFTSRTPTPTPYRSFCHITSTSGIQEDSYCQQDQMKWDLGGPVHSVLK